MQDIENNMDELFRKAGENYAPKKGSSQWDNILPALSEHTAQIITTQKNKQKKNRAFLLLLLLIISGAIALMKVSGDKNETKQLQVNTISQKNKPADLKMVNEDVNKKLTSVFRNKTNEKKSGCNKNGKMIEDNENIIPENFKVNNSSTIVGNNFENTNKKIKDDERNIDNLQIDSVGKTITQLNNSRSTKTSARKKIASIIKQHRLYIGFVAAPEFNQVKNQGIKKPGFDIGVIAGYKLSTKASLETGVLLNKKNYFSDGKYFSMDKIGNTMPSGMEVMSLKGSSNFLQIPVRFKYDLLHKKNAVVFSSAGISSYIITHEENDYLTLLNGSEQQMKGSYKNVAKYFAATFDVSAGYENKIGKFTSLRIEPYMQIPMKGVGMGSMRVTSVGLHVGVLKFIR